MADPLPDDVLAALRDDRRIEAIKLLRNARGIGLKEAREIVEAAVPRQARQPRPGPRTALGFAADRQPCSGLGPGGMAALTAGVAAFVWVLISRR